jgi:uncharacterized protein YqgV (UPF0045/DUF77 family)
MHQNIINAGLQLLPIHTELHPYDWVDAVIDIIDKSGLKYEVGAFNTSIEGTYRQVTSLVDEINEFLYDQKCHEWILGVQYQLRSGGDITAGEKTDKFRVTVE